MLSYRFEISHFKEERCCRSARKPWGRILHPGIDVRQARTEKVLLAESYLIQNQEPTPDWHLSRDIVAGCCWKALEWRPFCLMRSPQRRSSWEGQEVLSFRIHATPSRVGTLAGGCTPCIDAGANVGNMHGDELARPRTR